MDRLRPRTAAVVLDELFERNPHLPRPPDLVHTVVTAHNEPADGQPGGLAGVVVALWPIGAADGARCGHAVTLKAVLDVVARIRTAELPDARARWVLAAFAEAALELPAVADPQRTYPAPPVLASGTSLAGLRNAVEIGLANAWRAGHHDGTTRLLNAFDAAVEDLVGHERLATTFITAALPAHALLEEINYLAYRFSERDRENPTERVNPAAIVARSLEPYLLDARPQARAFRVP
jgi:hypothetical protein